MRSYGEYCSLAKALDVVGEGRFLTHPRRIDDENRLAIPFDSHVHAVPRRARNLGNDDAIFLGELIDERTLPRVPPTDDGEFDVRGFGRGFTRIGRQDVDNLLEQNLAIAAVIGAHGQGIAVAEAIEIARADVELRIVRFVSEEDHRPIEGAEPFADFLIQRHEPIADIDDEENDGSGIDGVGNLIFDVGREVVHIDDPHPAGIHEFEKTISGFDHRVHAIASHPGRGIDDADQATGEPVVM